MIIFRKLPDKILVTEFRDFRMARGLTIVTILLVAAN
jgi:hypothetical protein